MARNIKFTFKKGSVGKRMNFFLEDSAGSWLLTNYTVTLFLELIDEDAEPGAGTPVVNGVAVTNQTQTGSNIGRCYYDLTSTTANIAAGDYRGELKLVNGSTVLYWPDNGDGNRAYFRVRVRPNLA